MPRVRRGRQPRRRARLWVVVLALVVLAIATPGLVNLLVTYWWFGELGYGRVYATELAAAWALGLAGAVVAFLVLKSMAVFVTRIARAQGRAQVYRGWVPLAVNGAMVVLALLCGLGLAGNWQPTLFALRQVPFGVRDPIFHHDVAFYVFTLPLLQDLLGWPILAVLGVLAALALLANAFVLRRWLLIVAVIAAWLIAWIVLVGLYPTVVQGLKVNPAPLAAEAPQIGHNITATRAAFNLA